MKIDDIYNSNDSPLEKARKGNELFNQLSTWIDKQEEKVQEQHIDKFRHTIDVLELIFNEITKEDAERIILGTSGRVHLD